MTLLYLDTNIYLDYLEGRVELFRPLGEFAFQIFKRTLSCEFTLILSSLLVEELSLHVSKERIKEMLDDFHKRKKIIETAVKYEDKDTARTIMRERHTPFQDTLHMVVAKRMNASYFVTRNIKDFVELEDIIPIFLPENL